MIARLLDWLSPRPWCACGGLLDTVEVLGSADVMVCSACDRPARTRR